MQYVIVGAYVLLMVFVAIYAAKRAKTLDDFYLGGRNIGGWMSAFSFGTAYFSAVMFVGYAGRLGNAFGVSVVWIGIGNALIGSYLAWKVLAKPTRTMTQRLKVSTMPSFFEARYLSKNMKIFAAVIIFIFLVPYCASVYQGLSYVFEMAFHLPYQYCMIGMAVVSLVYLIAGGYKASSITDFIQGIVMLIGVITMIFFIINAPEVGGLTEGLARLGRIDSSKAALFGSEGNGVSLVASIITTSVGTWGLPQMVHKFYAIKDERAIQKGTVVSTIFALVVAGGTYFIGAFGTLFTGGQAPIDSATGAANADLIMPTVIQSALPEALLGLIVVLILAASMSTLCSLVLASSSAISMDLMKGTIKKDMSDKSTLMLMRVLCGVFVVASLVIALDKTNAILTLMSFSWGAISGSFLAPFMLGVRWKKMTRAGAWAGMITGIGVVVVLAIVMGLDTSKATLIAAIAIVSSLIVTPIVSLLTQKKGYAKEHVNAVFGIEE